MITYYSVSLCLSIAADNEEAAIKKFCDQVAAGEFKRDSMDVEWEMDCNEEDKT